jgi:hypothetical protein
VNQLTVRVRITRASIPSSDWRPWLVFDVLIDGVPIPPRVPSGIVAPLRALEASLRQPGEHYIFTCICGDPRDANLTEGVQVTHTATTLAWTARQPVPIVATFDRAQYAAAIAQAAEEARRLALAQPELGGSLPPELRERRRWRVQTYATEGLAQARLGQLRTAFARRYTAFSGDPSIVVGEERVLLRRQLDGAHLLGEATVLLAREQTRVLTLTALDRVGRLHPEMLLRIGSVQVRRPSRRPTRL